MSLALDAVIFATAWTHVILSPFSKVEESFNLHATHDVLMYGVGIESLYNYDHFTFPGAVPRTFVGSVMLAWASTPALWLASRFGYVTSKFDIQILVRLVLASFNAWTLCLIRRGVTRRFGRGCGLFFSLLTCSQFHLPFWMGRTIPNMFAMIPVNYATYSLIDRAPNSKKPSQASLTRAVALLTFAAVVFRAEVALLLAPLCLQLLVTRRLTFFALLKVGLLSGPPAIVLTSLVDSYFWGTFPLWPEISGIYFNVLQGKSSEWGTSPPLTYLTSYLPKLLLGSLPLSIVGFLSDKRIRSLLLPSFAFIGLISCLGHKEWRFIVYVVPIFNIAAARGAKVSQRKNSFFGRLLFLATCGLIMTNVAFTILSTKASMSNYPGGEALLRFHQLVKPDATPRPHVHISNLAAQTGASLFLHINTPPYHLALVNPENPVHPTWSYNKTENLTPSQLSRFTSAFTHLITEVSPETDVTLAKHWRTLETIKGFDRWAVDWELLRGPKKDELLERVGDLVRFEQSEKLWILERKI